MDIFYLDALAGAGKTRALVKYARKLAYMGEKVLFVQPSKLLIANTIKHEMDTSTQRYEVTAIHGDLKQDVVKSIVQYTQQERNNRGCILFITHEAFMHLPYIEDKKNWYLLFDEVPAVDVYKSINVPHTHKIITDLIELYTHDAAYGRLIAKDDRLENIATNKEADEVWRLFADIANKILSPHWDVYALQSNYRNLIGDSDKSKQLITYSLLKPSIFAGFKQTILASALFETSCLYHLWMRQDVNLKPVSVDLLSNLKYQSHDNGELLTIKFIADGDWSKCLRDKQFVSDGVNKTSSLCTILPDIIKSEMKDEIFAWMGNKDIADNYFNSDKAIRLPNSPHGLNSYQHIHNVAIISALNAPPAHFHFMNSRGVNGEDLKTAHYRSAVYQAVMRISVRNPDDMSPNNIIVMDKSTAHWLAGHFPGATVEKLNVPDISFEAKKRGRPKIYASDKDRVRAYRERKKALKNSLLATANTSGFGTVYSSIYDSDPFLHLDLEDGEDLIKLLRDLHRRTLISKQDNYLFTPSSFDQENDTFKTKRGLRNVRHVHGIWLDNDGGDLTYTEFARLFPTIRMIVWNTYSSTCQNPRWRCFIPTTQAVSAEVYKAIIEQIIIVLRHAGYVSYMEKTRRQDVKTHGFDTSKFVPSSLFYAPCQAADKEASFFHDFCDEGRMPIDPHLWVENDIRTIKQCKNSVTSDNIIQLPAENVQQIQSAVERWRSTPRGQGNRSFYRLLQDLKRAGLREDDIRIKLDEEVNYAASPEDRAADARRMLRKQLF